MIAAYLGEVAGITTALLWAFGTLLAAKAGRHIGSNAVNELRLAIALPLLLGAHSVVFGSPWPRGVAGDAWLNLSVSGLVGLALGDMCYFRAITLLGPRLGALLMAAAPAMTALLAYATLGERLSSTQVLGLVLTSTGLALVLSDRRGRREWNASLTTRQVVVGVVLGLLGALGQALGNVLSKRGAGSGDLELAPLSSVVIRMTAGTVSVLLIALVAGRFRKLIAATRVREARNPILLAVLFGPTCGVFLYQVAIQRSDAAIAAILVSLTPIYLIPIARIAYGSRITRTGLAGTLLAFAGTALVLQRP